MQSFMSKWFTVCEEYDELYYKSYPNFDDFIAEKYPEFLKHLEYLEYLK
jgi:hypothetical protein